MSTPPVAPAGPLGGGDAPAFTDAELTSVAFVDAQHGWVVGAGGLILHTADGGATWNRQASGVAARLRSVSFVDRNHGWAVGGVHDSYSHRGRGFVLHTTDGGVTWRRESTPLLPALRQVRFVTSSEGWAVGESSDFHPAGLFYTRDGGRTWSAAGGATPDGVLCGEMISPHEGLIATPRGELLPVTGRVVRETPLVSFELRAVRRVLVGGDGRGWLIGDGGLIQTTVDGGTTWHAVGPTLPGDEQVAPDWRSAAIVGSQMWIVGDPGGSILHSADEGRTWQLQPTHQPLPLNDVTFVDEQHGWAVGAMGAILRTVDGGRTWQMNLPESRRAALWSCFADATDVPIELVAQATLGDDYRAAAVLFGRREFDVISGDREFTADRATQAFEKLGVGHVAAAWQFPLRSSQLRLPPAQWLHAWQGADDADALYRAEAYLVRQLRTWRPDVVLTHAGSPRGDRPAEHLLNQLVVQAVESAADETKFPEFASTWGLAPWRVRRVFAHNPGQDRGTVTLAVQELDSRLGTSLAELCEPCRSLLIAEPKPPVESVAARLVVNRGTGSGGDRGLCAGLGIAAGSDARRHVSPTASETMLQLRDAAERRRNMQAIARRSAVTGEEIVGQLRDVVAGLDDDRAGRLIFQLGESFRQSGRWENSRDCYEFLLNRTPQHATAEAALTRLIHYQSSSEADHRLQRTASERRARALALAAFFDRRDPAGAAEPTIGFAAAAARRKLGQVAEAAAFYEPFFRTHTNGPWWECAAAEIARSTLPGQEFKRRHTSHHATTEPVLDGRLDDEIWLAAEPLELRSPLGDDAERPAVAYVAHDAEHLYLAVRCRRAPGDDATMPTGVRSRDADLADFDRVDFCLDLDRDYATYYRLTVDRRGWTAESCWGDSTWNPQWYVSAGGDEQTWFVEAAIPWKELVAQPPQPGDVWALGVQRLAPTAGFQAWTPTADAMIRPEGFGHLTFEAAPPSVTAQNN